MGGYVQRRNQHIYKRRDEERLRATRVTEYYGSNANWVTSELQKLKFCCPNVLAVVLRIAKYQKEVKDHSPYLDPNGEREKAKKKTED